MGVTGTRRYGIRVERFFNNEPLLERTNETAPFEKQLHCKLADWIPETGRWKETDIRKEIEPDVIRIIPE